MAPNHKIKLKKVTYKPLNQRFYKSTKKNPSHGLYNQNNQKLQFLPQITLGIIAITFFLVVIWFYSPLKTSYTTSPSEPGQVLAPDPISPVSQNIQTKQQNPSESSLSNDTSTTTVPGSSASMDSFTITSNTREDCVIQRTKQKPSSLNLADLSDQGWWIPRESSVCASSLIGINVIQLNPAQFQLIQSKVNADTTSLQLLDDKNTYALFFGLSQKPNYDGTKYLKPLTNGIITGTYFFDATKAFAQKRIGGSTYYLDGGCQAPRTEPCILWKMDNYSGLVTLLKKDIALTAANEAYEIKDSSSLRFSNTQDYTLGINLIFRSPAQSKTILLRVPTNSDVFGITSTIELTKGNDNYVRYI